MTCILFIQKKIKPYMFFDFDINFIFRKNNKNKTHCLSTQIYSQTLEIISCYIKNITNENLNPMENLKKFLNIIEQSENQKKNLYFKLNFIDELRFLILCNIDNSNKYINKILKSYHAILHLISLKHKYSCDYQIINEFLNSNWHLKDEEVELHAIRGNFGKIVLYYPELQEAIEELCILENKLRKKKINLQTYEILHCEWKNKYGDMLPKKIKEIVCGEKVVFNEHWTEILCYKLAYKNDNFSIIKFIKDIDVDLNDEIYFILSNQYEELSKKTSLWLKLVLNFIFFKSRIHVYECITDIAAYLYDCDWHVALEYFSFTLFSDFYFRKICEKVEMNPVIFDYLIRYSKRNGINSDSLCKAYSKYLINKKDYENLLSLVTTVEIPELNKNRDFIEYLIKNIEHLKIFDVDFFNKTVLGRFLYLYINLIVKNNSLKSHELDELFDIEITNQFITNIMDNLIHKKNVDEKILIKFLNYMNNFQKDLNLKDDIIAEYKKSLIYKLHDIISL